MTRFVPVAGTVYYRREDMRTDAEEYRKFVPVAGIVYYRREDKRSDAEEYKQ